ncbi:MAG: hypothetical protein R3B84_21885 [Zavarzinella sp.]
MNRVITALLCCPVMFLVGCSKLNFNQTVELTTGEVKTFFIDPPKSDQKVVVTINSTDAELSYGVVLSKNFKESVELSDVSDKDNFLLIKHKVKQDTQSITIPAKEEVVVLVGNSTKNTTVSVSLKSE